MLLLRDRPGAPAKIEATEGAWVPALSREKRAAIRELHRIKPAWNLIGLVFVAIWIGAGVLILAVPSWPLRWAGYAAIGVAIHGLGNLMHEGIHGNLFRNRRLDRLVGFVAGAPALFSVTAYRVTHLIHHRYNRTEQDPDEFTNLTKDRRLLSLAFYSWIVVGVVLYLFHVPITALQRGRRRERGAVVVEYSVLAGLYASIFIIAARYHASGAIVQLWVIPLGFAAVFVNVRGWAEHMMTVPGHPLTQSRTITSNRLLSLLNINLNYHLEHHLFPAMPWYNLPRLHTLLQDEYRAAGASIYRSYLQFLWDAARTGVHGLVPNTGRENRAGEQGGKTRRE
jgi:fatty acid desaturase